MEREGLSTINHVNDHGRTPQQSYYVSLMEQMLTELKVSPPDNITFKGNYGVTPLHESMMTAVLKLLADQLFEDKKAIAKELQVMVSQYTDQLVMELRVFWGNNDRHSHTREVNQLETSVKQVLQQGHSHFTFKSSLVRSNSLGVSLIDNLCH